MEKDTTLMSWAEIKEARSDLPKDDKAGEYWEEVNDDLFNFVMALLL